MRVMFVTALICISLLNCISSAHAQIDFSSFPNSSTVNSAYKVYWKLSETNITFGLDVASNGNWVGLGIAEPTSGSMGGADMAILEVSNSVVKLTDYWAAGKTMPYKDTCESWYLINSAVTSGGKVQAIFTRVLDTKDSQDRVINTTSGYFTRMIWALGSSGSLAYHNTNRGAFGLYLNGGGVAAANTSWSTAVFTMPNYTIPGDQDTTYGCMGFEVPRDKDYYIKRFDFVFANTTQKTQVHHLILFSCTNVTGEFAFYNNKPDVCFQGQQGDCREMIYAWAAGQDSYELPDDVSFSMGPDGVQFIMLQMHYSNPQLVSGEIDSSGVKIYYDTVPTTHLAGVMQVGDAFVQTLPMPAGQKEIHKEYSCPTACTNQLSGTINVFGSFLHAHGHATMLYSTHTSTSGKTTSFNRIEYYDSGFQQLTDISRTLIPGDRLNTHCVYQTENMNTSLAFGLATQTEMCIEFLWYYPKENAFPECTFWYDAESETNATFCKDTVVSGVNPGIRDPIEFLAKSFGAQPTQCTAFYTPSPTLDDRGKAATEISLSVYTFMFFLLATLFV